MEGSGSNSLRLLPAPHELRRIDPEDGFEVLAEDFRGAVAQAVGDFGDLQLAFRQQLLGPLHADGADEFDGGLAGELGDFPI